MRIKIIRIVIIILFAIIAAELFYVQVIQGRYYYSISKRNRIRAVPLEGWRGRIFDRNGSPLADNRVSYDVMIVPQEIEESDKLFAFVSDVLKVDAKELYQNYYKKKYTPFTPVSIAEDIDRAQAIKIEENKFLYPSLFIQETFNRVYPLEEAGAHVIGYVGKGTRQELDTLKEYGYPPRSTLGKAGVEKYYDNYLRGIEGGRQIEVNSRGQQVRMLSLKQPKAGQDIQLTIDGRVQQLAQELLADNPGVIIAMDMDNGEMLGMTSAPSFNPNFFVDQKQRNKTQRYFSNTQAPLINRAIKGVYPPGSVFKIPVALCALETKNIDQNKTFFCEGSYQLGGHRFGCTHVHGSQNLIEAIAQSCNVYFYHLGLELGIEIMHDYIEMFGLGHITNIDLPYESDGFLPSLEEPMQNRRGRWYKGDTLNFSIGQGANLTTPMQLVQMMATIANNGTVVQPHVIQSIEGKPVEWYRFVNKVKASKRSFETVQKGMRATVASYSGTAHALDINGLYIAGKTGTAQSSGDLEDHAWFVGYVKSDVRNIAFCVFLEHGGSSHNAALLARKFLLGLQELNVI